MIDLLYEAFWHMARPLALGAGAFHPKLGRAAWGMSTAPRKLLQWSRTERQDRRKLVWMHAPSVGEALMAQAIVEALRRERPDLQIIFTHMSPSAERMRERVGADFSCYLPPDTQDAMRHALDAVRPTAIAFVRTEIWPTLTRLALQRTIRLALVNAVLSEASSRLRRPARRFLRPAYQRLDAVGAINHETARRFERLGVPSARVRVTGDARFDQVADRIAGLDRGQDLLTTLGDDTRFTIVGGSTWPTDDARLLPAFAQLRARTNARLLLAPHEPDARHLAGAEQAATRAGLRTVRLAEVEGRGATDCDILLIDRVGILADLYAIADVAYVGGAFQSAGVHSVVEPAALGVPVLFGPGHQNAAEAQELLDCEGGWCIQDGESLERALDVLASQPERERRGAAALEYVQSRRGGAAANAALIAELL